MKNKSLWVDAYAPQTIEECILPKSIKEAFLAIVTTGKIPNLLLSGTSGIGKTATVNAMCKELGASVYFINGSDEGRFLDTIRQKAKSFASSSSLLGNQKVIFIDEADNTTNDVQLLLRACIEEFQNNCKFILTCNNKNKIIPALQSRCANIHFIIKGQEKVKLASQFLKRLSDILDENEVEYDKKVLVELVKTYFPDWRLTIHQCQLYSKTGKIDSGILSNIDDSSINSVISFMKNKKYDSLRKWVFSNLDLDPQMIMRKLYDNCDSFMSKDSIPSLILLIGKYQQTLPIVADKEIHLMAFFTEVMCECSFL